VGWIWRGWAVLVVAARYLILLGWIALVVLFGRTGSWPGLTARPVPRPAGSPAAEDLHGSVAHRD
jgi:hypothetical protein